MSENLFTYDELESSKEIVAEPKKVLPSIRKTNATIIAEQEKFLPQAQETLKLVGTKYSSSDLREFLLKDNIKIRAILIGNEPYFVAMDIANALDYGDTEAMTRRLDDDEIQNLQIVGFGNRGVNLINESGLYNAILGSNKPESKTFKKWVTKEVLPSIRKNGGYIAGQEKLSDEELLAKALLVANNVIQNKDKVITKQQETIADQAEIINAYQVADKIKRNKQELATLLNRKIRELADKQYNKQYHKAYLAVYEDFAKLHCFTHKIDMQFLRTNIDYLSECLKLVLDFLDKE